MTKEITEPTLEVLQAKHSELYQLKLSWAKLPWLPAKLADIRDAIKEAQKDILVSNK